MTGGFVRATHVDGFVRPLTSLQRAAWDARCGFVGHMLRPDRPQSFDELVRACQHYAATFDEAPYTAEKIARDLVELLELDLARVVTLPGRLAPSQDSAP